MGANRAGSQHLSGKKHLSLNCRKAAPSNGLIAETFGRIDLC
jgi:hypothetical protein